MDESKSVDRFPGSGVRVFDDINKRWDFGIGGGGGGVGMGAERLRAKIGGLGFSSSSLRYISCASSFVFCTSPQFISTSSEITFSLLSVAIVVPLGISCLMGDPQPPKRAFQLSGKDSFPSVCSILEHGGLSVGFWCQHFFINSDNEVDIVFGKFGLFPLQTELHTWKKISIIEWGQNHANFNIISNRCK